MPILSRIHASALAGIQETTVALASCNFDFSLVKVQPPKEYQAIGKNLSPIRVKEAESGSLHIIARKLHALFIREIVPSSALLAAYGKRATEIVETENANPKGTKADGAFRSWVGADGTSLWAAATSGSAAIALHLLACMLARVFTASEAIAIWEELVRTRKHCLSACEDLDPLFVIENTAAQIEISGKQLAEWDASARAWLTVADQANQRRQIQTMLLLQKIEMPVNQKEKLYDSVLQAWKSALSHVDSIIGGRSCSVVDGAVLLALSSWHIYPDLHVLGTSSGIVKQNDPLIPAGTVVTLGTSKQSPDAQCGVYWSLPLAHLRYYGDPIPISRTLLDRPGRLTQQEVLLTSLGAVFSNWRELGDDFEKAAELIRHLSSYVLGDHLPAPTSHWLKYLGEAADSLLTSDGIEKDHFRSLIGHGRRRFGSFLAQKKEHPPPMFGLSTINSVCSLITDTEHKIDLLRFLSLKINTRPDALIIRYRRPSGRLADQWKALDSQMESGRDSDFDFDFTSWLSQDIDKVQKFQWEYASALPTTAHTKKRKHEDSDSLLGYTRWTEKPSEDVISLPAYQRGEDFQELKLVSELATSDWDFRLDEESQFFKVTRATSHSAGFKFLFGDATAAVFRRSDQASRMDGFGSLDSTTLAEILTKRWINHDSLVGHIDCLGTADDQAGTPYIRSLRALAAAMDIYKLMPNATISTSLFTQPLHKANWVIAANRISVKRFETRTHMIYHTPNCFTRPCPPYSNELTAEPKASPITLNLNRPQSFACIATFENRNVDMEPDTLGSVLAVSSGNSIYLAMPLSCDPCDQPSPNEIKHITGNVGKPGVSLMIPPAVPKMRKPEIEAWRYVKHNLVGKSCEYGDTFAETSLHLSFTRYEIPAGVRNHGLQAIEAQFIETLVSVYERDEWVCDLDILKALDSNKMMRVEETGAYTDARKTCRHAQPSAAQCPPKSITLTVADSWDEVLERAPTPMIVTAEGNWYARLALAAAVVQMGDTVVVFRDRDAICWQCLQRSVREGYLAQSLVLSAHCCDEEHDNEKNTVAGEENEHEARKVLSRPAIPIFIL